MVSQYHGLVNQLLHFAQGEANDLVLWVYTPDSTQDGSWTDKAEIKLTDVLGPCDVRSVNVL